MSEATRTGEALVIQRQFDAPAEVVWQMWIDPDEFSAWYGLGAPRATPTVAITVLNGEVNAALADPAFKAQLEELGGIPFSGTPAEFRELITSDTEKIGKVIRVANITIE